MVIDGHESDVVRLTTLQIRQLASEPIGLTRSSVAVSGRSRHQVGDSSTGCAPGDLSCTVVTVQISRYICSCTWS